MITYTVYCPNCDHKLWVEEETNNYVILNKYGGRPINECPNCGIRLKVENGELKEDEL